MEFVDQDRSNTSGSWIGGSELPHGHTRGQEHDSRTRTGAGIEPDSVPYPTAALFPQQARDVLGKASSREPTRLDHPDLPFETQLLEFGQQMQRHTRAFSGARGRA